LSNRNHRPANRDTGPKAPAVDAPLEQFASDESAKSALKIETQFEIVDNTEVEAAPEREAESSERQLDNGMTVVDYV
jgi:hypothetical protein